MRKILFYIDSMQCGGANRVMANLVDYFSHNGYIVVLINDVGAMNGKLEYKIPSLVKRIIVSDYMDIKENRVIKNMKRVSVLRRIVKEEAPDVIVSFMGPPNVRMLIATTCLRVKKVVSVRNDPYKEYGGGIKKIIANILFQMADGCVLQTHEASQYFNSKICKKAKVIFNPVNPKFYKQLHIENGSHIIVVGRLQTQKNPILVFDAFLEIFREFPDSELDFFGVGVLEKEIQEKTKEFKLEKRVYLKGQVDNIEDYLKEASVYVLCSDYEGMPNALMEAMAVGVPVISTDCPSGGPKVLIQNSQQGLLIPCGDKQKLVDSLRLLLSNKSLREKMGISARKRAYEFKSEKIFKEWENYLNNV